MAIGYACIALGVHKGKLRSCTVKNANDDKLREITRQNLAALECVIDFNIENDIKLFRISSDIIPFGSHPINIQKWWEEHQERFERIGSKIINSGMRVSMHPGQYTVLNSPNQEVVLKAMQDLVYHEKFLTTLGVDGTHKLILHIGGVYGDKEAAIHRFIENYHRLSDAVKARLVIENDERCYSISDVYEISKVTGAPVIFDNLHHQLNWPKEEKDLYEWIRLAGLTWKAKDGLQKIHYSQQLTEGKPGAHSETIKTELFLEFYRGLKKKDMDVDIMLEVKDKNLSAIKCNHIVHVHHMQKMYLEREWARYKYLVLSQSASRYMQMRQLMKREVQEAVEPFYHLVEEARELPFDRGAQQNAALHVWGYFKNRCTLSEKKSFHKKLDGFMEGRVTLQALKNYLCKLAQKYNEEYLLNSYYFAKD